MSKLWRFIKREGGKEGEGSMELEEEKGHVLDGIIH